MTNKKAKHHQ